MVKVHVHRAAIIAFYCRGKNLRLKHLEGPVLFTGSGIGLSSRSNRMADSATTPLISITDIDNKYGKGYDLTITQLRQEMTLCEVGRTRTNSLTSCPTGTWTARSGDWGCN